MTDTDRCTSLYSRYVSTRRQFLARTGSIADSHGLTELCLGLAAGYAHRCIDPKVLSIYVRVTGTRPTAVTKVRTTNRGYEVGCRVGVNS